MIFGHYINDLHILRTKFRLNKGINPEQNWIDNPQGLAGADFQDWFDSSASEEDSIKQARKDFEQRILVDQSDLIFKNSCEVGFGGGRLLLQASSHFENAYGIDIHGNFKQTDNFLKKNGANNCHLTHFKDKDTLPQIDFFYSFIVIQHFKNIKVLEDYLNLIYEKLSPNGVAVLWYGKLSTPFWGNFYEVPTSNFRRRECSLYIRPKFMEELCSNFQIVQNLTKHPRNVDENSGQSMQAKIVLKKK